MKHLIFVLFLSLLFCVSLYSQNITPNGLNKKSLTALTFVDIDNDGDFDAFGVTAGLKAGEVFFHENIGTKGLPEFTEPTSKPFGLKNKSLSSLTFVDIDNDGDFDAFGVTAGLKAGEVFFHENVGTNESPEFSKPTDEPFGLKNKSLTALTFSDIDNDGDFDAFGVTAGLSAGEVFFHENIGTNEAPAFAEPTNEPFGLKDKSLSSLTFLDIDNDGDSDVCGVTAGLKAGEVFFCENIGTEKSPGFSKPTDNFFRLKDKSLSALTFVDINNDGIVDAFGVTAGLKAGEVYCIELKK